ncbi:unnamed protein product, partial [Tenebrio molitor]
NTLTCAVLIFIICFGYLRQFCCLVWYISGVLLIYPTKFEIYYFVMDPSMVTLDNKNENRLHCALVNSDTTVLTQMLREGYNMSKIVFGFSHWSVKYTPLEFVVCWNNLPLVLFLLEKGVNPNVGRKNPLIISIKRGFYQISEKLIILGANTCKPDKNGKTPLYWAVDTKNKKIINLLLDHGAELTIHTALLHAIDLGYLDVVQLLVERGAP